MSNILAITFLVLSTVAGAFGGLFLKKGSKKLFSWSIFTGLALYCISAGLFILGLRTTALSFLYPLTCLGYIWVTLLSVFVLKERMNVYKWLGISVLIIGIVLVSL